MTLDDYNAERRRNGCDPLTDAQWRTKLAHDAHVSRKMSFINGLKASGQYAKRSKRYGYK